MEQKNYVKEEDIYNYRELLENEPNKLEIYSKINEKFEELFEEYSQKYEVSNWYFYIDNNRLCSSSATNVGNSQNIIKISCGYPLLMYKKLYESNLSNNERIMELYKELIFDEGFDFNEFFLECSVRFTFFHEFRHILQFENRSNLFSERVTNEFSQERHLFEIDADQFAVVYIIDFVYDTYERLNNRSKLKLENLLYIALGSIITTNLLYFVGDIHFLDKNKVEFPRDVFYTKEKSHPHNLVRAANLIEFYKSNIEDEDSIKFEIVDLIKFSFEIALVYIEENLISEDDLLRKYIASFEHNLDKINSYNEEMFDLMVQHPKIKRLREKIDKVL